MTQWPTHCVNSAETETKLDRRRSPAAGAPSSFSPWIECLSTICRSTRTSLPTLVDDMNPTKRVDGPPRSDYRLRHSARYSAVATGAEFLVFPAGIITAAFLTRALGARDLWPALPHLRARSASRLDGVNGRFWTSSGQADFGRYRSAGYFEPNHDGESWHRGLVSSIFALLAWQIAKLVGQAALGPFLLLASVEIVMLPISRAHRDILTGYGHYQEAGLAAAVFHISRLFGVVLLVLAGYNLVGVIVAERSCPGRRDHLVPPLCKTAPLQRQPCHVARSFRHPPWGLDLCPLPPDLQQRPAHCSRHLQDFRSRNGLLRGCAEPRSRPWTSLPRSCTNLDRSDCEKRCRQPPAQRLAQSSLRIACGLCAMAAPVAAGAAGLVATIFGKAFAPAAPLFAWLIIGGSWQPNAVIGGCAVGGCWQVFRSTDNHGSHGCVVALRPGAADTFDGRARRSAVSGPLRFRSRRVRHLVLGSNRDPTATIFGGGIGIIRHYRIRHRVGHAI